MSIEFIPMQRKPLLLTIVATALLALAYGQVVASAEVDQGLLIGIIAAVGAAAAKAFGNEREDAGEDAQGGNPMTRFILGAINAGDFDKADEMVSADFRAYANGYPVMSDEVSTGPVLVRTMISYWREAIPDVHWELYDEVTGEPEDVVTRQDERIEHRIRRLLVLRAVSRGTVEGEEHEIELAAFGTIVDDQLSELRIVIDLTVFNVYRMAIGLAPIE